VGDLAIAIPNLGKKKILFKFKCLTLNGIFGKAGQITKSGYKLKVEFAY
jgi:hypothetical protein